MSPSVLPPGQIAPNFTLEAAPGQSVSLIDLRGAPVILAFYPADWSPVCGDELALFNELLPEFERLGATLLGISVDSVWSHLAFAEARNYQFPLLADFEPKGNVAKAYGVYRSQDGTSERALFVIDSEGVVAWSHVSPIDVNPGANGILAALRLLDSGESDSDLTLPVSERDHIWGSNNAPITLVEYGDYECPHCGAAYPIVKELLEQTGDQVRFVFRNFPLTQIHAHAEQAAEAAEIGSEYGSFWPFHDLIFENQRRLDRASLVSYAVSLEIDPDEFSLRLSNSEMLPRIKEDFMSGVDSGVNGTPTFFINGRRHEGAFDLASLLHAVRSAQP